MQKPFTLFLFFLLSHSSQAQPTRNWDKPMELQKCSISVRADLFTATTFIQMEFFNPNAQEIEGLYRFSLQPGQAVTAFQLDLFGKFRDGSIEERWKAANAYNTIVGKRVDPALLQMDDYNGYSLRIYPVPAKGTRRITLTIRQVLTASDDTLHYCLPLTNANKLQRFEVNVDVRHTATKVVSTEGLMKGHEFIPGAVSQSLHFAANDFVWDKQLAFSVALPKTGAVCRKSDSGKTVFALRHFSSAPKTHPLAPKRIAVFWDASHSGQKRDAEKEISFLKQYIAYHGITELTIVPFNYKTGSAVCFDLTGRTSGWVSFLRSLTYEGATGLGNLDFDAANADAVFLVSDGYNSYGAALPAHRKSVVFCVHAAALADNATLNNIIGNSGGRTVDLRRHRISEAIALAGAVESRLLSVRSASGKTVVDARYRDEKGAQCFFAGTTTAAVDTLLFEYGNAVQTPTVERVPLQSTADCEGAPLERIPALLRFDELLRKRSLYDLLPFGKDEGIVTYNTSYIVLEKVEDYVKFNIKPPKELEAACEQLDPGINVRNKRDDRLRQQKQQSEFEILVSVANRYNDRIRKWGGSDFVSLTPPDVAKQKNITSTEAAAGGTPGADASAALPGLVAGGASELSEVVVIGYGTSRRRSLTGAVATVHANEIPAGTASVEQALQGRVPGVMVTNNASPFRTPFSSINIRGVSTLGNGSPLFVLDGVPIAAGADGRFNINDFVNVPDIERIDVLKDVSATAIYGSRGVNGVIVIQTKRGVRNYWNRHPGPYKLKAMEDVEYLQEIKAVGRDEKLAKYRELQPMHEDEPGFYLDMAQHLYESGWKREAMAVLTTAAEVLPGNVGMQRTVAHFLGQWGEWQEAIRLYEAVLKSAPVTPQAYRDLALAHAQNNQVQRAIDLLYEGIRHDWGQHETWHTGAKEILLNDLNALAARHQPALDLSAIPEALLKPLPVDLRIVLECTGGSVYGTSVVEPGGKVCREHQQDGNGHFTPRTYAGLHEYQAKEAAKGTYKIRVNYYASYGGAKQPGVIRLTVYKNFGKPDQTVTVENIMMDNQHGEVEIAEVTF